MSVKSPRVFDFVLKVGSGIVASGVHLCVPPVRGGYRGVLSLLSGGSNIGALSPTSGRSMEW